MTPNFMETQMAHNHSNGARVQPDTMQKQKTGTTVMAFCGDGVLVLACDSRTSQGSYIANRCSFKIETISPSMSLLRSGATAHTQYAAEYLRTNIHYRELLDSEKPCVKHTAAILRNFLYENRQYLQGAIILGGVDDEGPHVYQIPLGGALLERDIAVGGSGSVFISAFIDEHYREGMNKEDAIDFAKAAVTHAMSRDGSSGGVVRIRTIDLEGKSEDYTFTGDEVRQ
ncbi:hypothetical protein PCE1_000442 [Barthelona sp. PCE]